MRNAESEYCSFRVAIHFINVVSALGSKQIKDCMDEKPGQILWPFLQDKMQNIFYKVSPNI